MCMSAAFSDTGWQPHSREVLHRVINEISRSSMAGACVLPIDSSWQESDLFIEKNAISDGELILPLFLRVTGPCYSHATSCQGFVATIDHRANPSALTKDTLCNHSTPLRSDNVVTADPDLKMKQVESRSFDRRIQIATTRMLREFLRSSVLALAFSHSSDNMIPRIRPAC